MRRLECLLSTPDGAPWLRPAPDAPLQHDGDGNARAVVDSSRRMQTIEGFGGAFTEAAAVNWLRLDDARREAALQAYFGAPGRNGHGYRLCRVHINSCDFSLGSYAHVEQDGDFALRSFSIERDRRALLPLIHAAQRVAGAPLNILASPWSPPAWMKTNGTMVGGGKLRPECRDAWANCYVRFIQAYADEGVPIWAVSVQNEPQAVQVWESCLYAPEEERDFVRDHLGPALRAAGLGHVRIVGWDHNLDLLPERAAELYGDADAAANFWGLGFHWYGAPLHRNLHAVHDAWPDKALLFTEGCQEGGPHVGSWDVARRYASQMIAHLNGWSVGWIDWNLFLDMRGGPNHVGNFCSAPVLIDDSGEWHAQPAYAAIGHFARVIAPGAQRVLCAGDSEELALTAARNPDGSIAVVALGARHRGTWLTLSIDGQHARVHLPADALLSCVLQPPEARP